MLARIKRLIRAVFGGWIDKLEDPVLILKQNIRDLNDQVPRMNEGIAMIRANLNLLETEYQRYVEKSANLTSRIKAALSASRRDLALNYATTLEEIKESIQANRKQLELATAAYQHALKAKQVFMKEKELRTREAMRAIRAAERAKWQREIAGAMENFEPTGIAQTHEEMVNRVEERAAKDQAYLHVALHTAEAEGIQIDEEIRKLEANEIVADMEREMGMTPESEPPGTEPGFGLEKSVQE